MIKKKFRSRLNELPTDFKFGIAELPYQKGMRASSKRLRAIELLKKFEIPYVELGTGTNRFIVKYDGYALKMALDMEGVADNKQEWVMSYPLNKVAPNHKGAANAYEISKGGNFLMSQYAGAFQSYGEFLVYRKEMYAILSAWNRQGFLLGDVGTTKINYANWGLLPTGEAVCIDYAYIFPANMDLFECNCGCKHMKMNEEFTMYYCEACGKQYEDRELRARISKNERLKLFQDVEGYEMFETMQEFEVDDIYDNETKNNPDVISDEEAALEVAKAQINGYSSNWYNIGGL